ncbi:MAG: hypothetical protein OXE44_08270 [Nitrospinae bacterium]|nr:hypothetical protein [Nitrospinota bacterium]
MAVVNRKIASQQEIAYALRNLTDADLRRLERIARFRIIGLNDLDWQDLLHDAVARLLDGTRRWPKDIPLVVFLRETMRSIVSEHWRRKKNTPVLSEAQLHRIDDTERHILENAPDTTTNPERQMLASETLAKIEKVFQGDPEAMRVILGMAVGKSPNEIQKEAQMSSKRYATTQRRIRRKLAREFADRRVTK